MSHIPASRKTSKDAYSDQLRMPTVLSEGRGSESSGILDITSRRKTADIGGGREKTFAAIAKSLLKGHVRLIGGVKVCLVTKVRKARRGVGARLLPE